MKQNIFLLTLQIEIEKKVKKAIDLESIDLITVNKNELMMKLYELNPRMLIIDVNSYTKQTLKMIQSVLSIEFVPVLYTYNNDISKEVREILSGSLVTPVYELDSTLPLLSKQSSSFKNRYDRLMDSYEAIDSINGQIKRFLEKYVHENQLEEMNIIKDILRFVFIENVFLRNKPKEFWLVINEDDSYNACLFTLTQDREIIQKDIISVSKEEFGFDVYAPNGFFKNFNSNEFSDIDSDDDILPIKMKTLLPNISNFAGYAIGEFIIIGMNYPHMASNYEVAVLKSITVNIDLLENIKFQMKEVKQSSIYTMNALARAAEVNDDNTGHHVKRVNIFSKLLAEGMGLNKAFIEELYYSAQMHDVGKIYVDKIILTKPGKLTKEEFEHMKLHTVYGEKIIGDSQHLKMACEIAVNHHERFDGTGYPNGKKGEEIPLSSRIVLLADIYDALRCERSYKPAFSHEKTYEIITQGDGRVEPTHFDPRVLETFRMIHKEFSKVYEELS